MKKFYYLILLISGCVSNQDAHSPISSFSKKDLNTLIENSKGMSFQKTVVFNQKTETKKVIFTKEKFEKELSFFYELDINNPEFAKTFTKDSISTSNKRYVLTYTKNKEEKHHLESIKESFYNNKLEKIEGVFNEKSPLFFSTQKIKLDIFLNQIKSYSIQTKQSLVTQDTNYYEVKAVAWLYYNP